MKICSLLPSGTEILFALGLGDQVIGVTDLCDYPPEVCSKRIVCRSKIDVSVLSSDQVEELMHRLLTAGESPYDLDQEWLLEQSPDVVLTQDLCYFCEVDAAAVKRAVRPIPVQPQVVVLQPRTLREVFDSIGQVGRACGATAAANVLVQSLEQRVQGIRCWPRCWRQNLNRLSRRASCRTRTAGCRLAGFQGEAHSREPRAQTPPRRATRARVGRQPPGPSTGCPRSVV